MNAPAGLSHELAAASRALNCDVNCDVNREASREASREANREAGQEALPRLAYLVSCYPAVSHTFILREVRQLRARGFDIRCASVNSPDRSLPAMTDDEREEAAQTYYLKAHGWRGALLGHLWGCRQPWRYWRGLRHGLAFGGWDLRRSLLGFCYFTEALMLARWLAQNQVSHLHVHFATAAANIALLLKQFAPVSLSLTVHGPDEFYEVSAQKLPEKIAAADFLVCIGRFARSQLMKLTPASAWEKFEVCPLGVDPVAYQASVPGRQRGRFTICCVGRLTPAKGQQVLLQACAVLRDWGRDFHLLLVGSGPDEAALRDTVAGLGLTQQVEFCGPLNQAQVRLCYQESHVFALPSFAEGIPVALMEAMACGLPCVTTRITGIPELIRDGIDGLLVTPSDVQELADTLAQLMDDPELRQELAAAGRLRVSADYNLKTNVARLGRIFQARLRPGAGEGSC